MGSMTHSCRLASTNRPRSHRVELWLALICFVTCLPDPARAEVTWEVFQLTTGTQGHRSPHVSGTTYVWQRGSSGNWQILMWSEGDAEPVVISTSSREYYPRISGRRVVWESDSGGDYEIYLWDDGFLSTLTSNTTDDRFPYVGGYGMVWLSQGDDGLLYSDGQQQQLITAGASGPDLDPSVQDNLVTWYVNADGVVDGDEVFFWNGEDVRRLTDNLFNDVLPETDGRTIVWQSDNGPSRTGEIWKWTPERGVVRLTNNSAWDGLPDVSGEAVVFSRLIGGDFEIMMLFDNVEYQITDNGFDDFAPKIDGKRITWQGAPSGKDQVFYAAVEGIDGGGGDDIGACCIDLTCIETTEVDCTLQGGTFKGVEASCDEDTCGRRPALTWSTLQHDAQRTGRTTAVIAAAPSASWALFLGVGAPDVSPVIRPDGGVYTNTGESLAAVTPDGSLVWLSPGDAQGHPAVREDGRYFVGLSGLFVKVHADTGVLACASHRLVRAAAALDVSGDVFVNEEFQLSRLRPDCDEIWATGFSAYMIGSPAIGLDGAVHVSTVGDFSKVAADGTVLWTVLTQTTPGAPAVAGDGTVFRNLTPNSFIATYPDGSPRWSLTVAEPNFEASLDPPAIALDGTAYFTGRFNGTDAAVFAIAPEGAERWRFVAPGGAGPHPAIIDGNGLVIFATRRGQIIALSPADGSEQWRFSIAGRGIVEQHEYTRSGREEPIDEGLPPVESRISVNDAGTARDVNVRLRLDHQRVGDLDISLMHENVRVQLVLQPCGNYRDFDCTRLDDEAPFHMGEQCQNGFCASYKPESPLRAYDGLKTGGSWELTIRDRATGNTGVFHEWTLELEVELGDPDDYLEAPPIIGDDGTLYVKTGKGFLKAFGAASSCPPADALVPPFSYRRVVSEQELIENLTVSNIESFQLGEDGRASFLARVAGGHGDFAAFVEQADGTFHVVEEGRRLDGQLLDDVHAPRLDHAGNQILPAFIQDEGGAVFVNDRLMLARKPGPVEIAPVILHDFADDFFDVDPFGQPMLKGQETDAQDPLSILSIRPQNESVERLLSVGDVVDGSGGFTLARDLRHRRQVNSAGSYVLSDRDRGVVVDGSLDIRNGDVIDGRTVFNIQRAEINDAGELALRAEHAGGHGIFSRTQRRVGTGDVIDGFTLSSTSYFEMNHAGQLAFTAQLSNGKRGIFLNDRAVAVESVTVLDGSPVEQLYDRFFALNEPGDVAFVARVGGARAVYVAQDSGIANPPFVYRRVVRVGDELPGVGPVGDVDWLDLSDDGRISARGTVTSALDVAPLKVNEISKSSHFTVTGAGRFAGYLRDAITDPFGVSFADSGGRTLTPAIQIGDVIEGMTVEQIFSGQFEDRLADDAGHAVVHARGRIGQSTYAAILTESEVVVKAFDFVGGKMLTDVSRPEMSSGGDLVFRGAYDLGGGQTGTSLFSPTQRLLGTNDLVDGRTLSKLHCGSRIADGRIAALVEIAGAKDAVVFNGRIVCIEEETVIDGWLIDTVRTDALRANDAGQVAFAAVSNAHGADALFVATPTGDTQNPFTYRFAIQNGESHDGVTVGFLSDFRLSPSGRVSVYSRQVNPDPARVFIEQSPRVFLAWTKNDFIGGWKVVDFGTAPQFDADESTYILADAVGVGPVVFMDETPVLQSELFATVTAYLLEAAPGDFDVFRTGDAYGGFTLNLSRGPQAPPRFDAAGNVTILTGTDEVGETIFRNGQPLVQNKVNGATAPIRLPRWVADAMFDVSDAGHLVLYGRVEGQELDGLLRVDAADETVEQVFLDGADFPGWRIEAIDTDSADERHSDGQTKTFVARGEGRVAVMNDRTATVRNGKVIGGKTLTDFASPQIDGSNLVFMATFASGNGLFTPSSKIIATGDALGGSTVQTLHAHSMTAGVSAFTATLTDGRVGVFRGTAPVAIEQTTLIDGRRVEDIRTDGVRKIASGAVAFVATLKNDAPAIFVASGADGQFTYRRVAGVGDTVDDHVFDFDSGFVHCPRETADGTAYQFVALTQGGQTVLAEGRPVLQQEGPEATADLTVAELHDQVFDAADGDYLAAMGRLEAAGPVTFFVANPRLRTLSAAAKLGDPMGNGHRVGSFRTSPAEGGFVNNDGDSVVVAVSEDGTAESVQGSFGPYVKSGDRVDVFTVLTFDHPQISDGNKITYVASYVDDEGRSGNGVFRVPNARLAHTGQTLPAVRPVDFQVTGLEERGLDASGSVVAAVRDGEILRIVTQERRVAEDGQIIDGWKIHTPISPQILDNGLIMFHAEIEGGGDGLFTPTQRLLGAGDVVAEGVVSAVEFGSMNQTQNLAAGLRLEDGRAGVYIDGGVAVLEQETVLDGSVVVQCDTNVVRLGDDGTLALIARPAAGSRSIYVADVSGGPPFAFRRVVAEGDTIGGAMINSLGDFRIGGDGSIAFRAGTSSGVGVFIETAPGVFASLLPGRSYGGQTLTDLQTPPRVDASGRVFLLAGTAEHGDCAFVDAVLLMQEDTGGAVAPIVVTDLSALHSFTVRNDGTFTAYLRQGADDSHALALIDAGSHTVTSVLSTGDADAGYELQSVDTFWQQQDRSVAYLGRLALDEQSTARAVVAEGAPVLIEGVDVVDGERLSAISPVALRYNKADQLLLLAELEASGTSLILGEPTGHSNHPYVFHKVASVGESIGGVAVGSIDDWRLAESGRVRFVSRTGAPAQFIEQEDGNFVVIQDGEVLPGRPILSIGDVRMDGAGRVSFTANDTPDEQLVVREMGEGAFRVLAQGSRVGELVIDFSTGTAFAPRVTPGGTELMWLPVRGVGPIVFHDGRPLVQKKAEGQSEAPAVIHAFERTDYVDVDHAGNFLVHGRITEADRAALLHVDSQTAELTRVIGEGDRVEGFAIERISPTPWGAYGPDGVPVFMASDRNGLDAILTPHGVIARVGDVIDGRTLDDIQPPRRNSGGAVAFLSDGNLFLSDVEGAPPAFVRGVGDTIAGLPILGLTSQMPNDRDDIAFTALITGDEEGVFLNEEPVAVSGLSRIRGKEVLAVRDGSDVDVAVNGKGQVLFVARLADQSVSLFVATRKSPQDGNGDCRLDLEDWASLSACMAGPAAGRQAECAIFDFNGDCRVDLQDVNAFMQRFTGEGDTLPDCP